MYDPDIRAMAKSPAVLPVGSTEQHGPHLPVTTDTDIASAVSAKLAPKIGAVLMPAIQYGVSFEHAPLFQASVAPGSLAAQVESICRSLDSVGIGPVFAVNGHHGNVRALGGAGSAHVLHYWRFAGEFDHAGRVETSLMLAFSDKVRMDLAVAGLDEGALSPQELSDAKRAASRCFPEATGNGVWGDPRGATREEGERIAERVVAAMARQCRAVIGGRAGAQARPTRATK